MIELTHEPIDTTRVLALAESPLAGAVVLFLGTTRAVTGQQITESLDYECFPEMAERKLAELENEARARWPILECAIVHRLGRVDVGSTSVAVAVSTPHRKAAFEAGQWLIDRLKETAPIWKKEVGPSGSHWVHPGIEPSEANTLRTNSAESRRT